MAMSINKMKAILGITVVTLAAIVAPIARATVIVTTVGSPTFVPTDFHLFAAPIGTMATSYAEFVQTLQAILPPPDHVLNPIVGIGPGLAHPGPYDHEIGRGVAANAFVDSTTFPVADYSNGVGVLLAFMVVPGPGSTTGSSPDFTSDPIIPNAILPLTATFNTFTNGALNDNTGATVVPAVDQIGVPTFAGLEGYSHIPFFFVDNFDFASQKIAGDYEYRIALLDAAGNGYDIVAPFQVTVPEPSTWMMMMLGFAGLGYAGRRKTRTVPQRSADERQLAAPKASFVD
jgi:hypothetical protein